MKGFVNLVLLDLVLFAILTGVLADEQWKAAYAIKKGMQPTIDYSILTQYFSMKTLPMTLVSPPTLSWIEVVVVLLAVSNGLFLYRKLRSRDERDSLPAS